MRIDACFDSHVHWAFTGEHAEQLRLDDLTAGAEVLKLKVEPHHRRGEWILGFGWDAHAWTAPPHRSVLDEWFPDSPVALARRDGHALWINTAALKLAGLWEAPGDIAGGRVERDADGRPTGILVDQAAELVAELIPRVGAFELGRQMLKAMRIFNKAGYTHIRDMTCDQAQWHEAVKLDEAGVLTMAVEEYFWLKSPAQVNAVLDLARRARAVKSKNLRVMGVKLFLDGALGSEGAYISRCYHGRGHQGLLLWEPTALSEALTQIWQADLHVAVHVIGDEACDRLANLALKLKEKGISGPLHLEHCELVRPETIHKLRELKAECHLQPSHWLSDRIWLAEKLGDLSRQAFPWRALQEAEIAFDFGSDAPIEPPSVDRIYRALAESAEAGVPRLLGNPDTYMRHRDLSWAPNTYTLFEDHVAVQVVFRGEHL